MTIPSKLKYVKSTLTNFRAIFSVIVQKIFQFLEQLWYSEIVYQYSEYTKLIRAKFLSEKVNRYPA